LLYIYDEVNRVISKDLPGAAATTFGYYDTDLIKWETDANGNTINYRYDDYGRLLQKVLGGTFTDQGTVTGGDLIMEDEYFQENSGNGFKSQLSNSKTATVSGENNFDNLLTTDFVEYDEYVRLKKSIKSNNVGGSDEYTFKYDSHADNIAQIKRDHIGYETINIIEDFTFDHSFRQLTHRYNSSLLGGSRLLSSNEYTYKDELKSKNVGGIQNLNYNYNDRSWLKTINSLGSSHRFNEEISCIPPVTFPIDIEIIPFTPCADFVGDPMIAANSQSDVVCGIECDNVPNIQFSTADIPRMEQEIDALKEFTNSVAASAMSYPQNLVRVRFFNREEIHITESELLLAQSASLIIPDYLVVQVIPIYSED